MALTSTLTILLTLITKTSESPLSTTDWDKVINDMLTTSEQPSMHPVPHHQNFFNNLGIVEPTRDWMHLHGTYNLTDIKLTAQHSCHCHDFLKKEIEKTDKKNAKTAKYLVSLYGNNYKLDKQCSYNNETIDHLNNILSISTSYHNAPGTSDGKQKRAVPLLLFSAISRAIGPSGFKLAKFVIKSLSAASFIFSVGKTAYSVRKYDKEAKLPGIMSYHPEELGRAMASYSCIAAASVSDQKLQNFNTGITELMQHRYPHSLIHLNEIVKELHPLAAALQKRDLRLLYQTGSDVATAPSSFIVKNNTLHFFIHVPITHAPILTAFKYIPTPTIDNANNISKLTLVRPDQTILAITQQKDTYIELNDLSDCTELGAKRFLCPNTPVLRHSPHHSCLYALYTSNLNNTFKYCSLSEFKRNYFATELSPSKFYLYTKQPNTATIQCVAPTQLANIHPFRKTLETVKEKTRTVTIAYSSSIIELTPHCHLNIFNLSLYPSSKYKTDIVIAKEAIPTGTSQFFHFHSLITDTPDHHIAGPPHTNQWNSKLLKKYSIMILVIGSVGLTIVLAITIISVPIFCVKRRNGRFIAKAPLRTILNLLHSRETTTTATTTPTPKTETTPPATASSTAPTSTTEEMEMNETLCLEPPKVPTAPPDDATSTTSTATVHERRVALLHEPPPGEGHARTPNFVFGAVGES